MLWCLRRLGQTLKFSCQSEFQFPASLELNPEGPCGRSPVYVTSSTASLLIHFSPNTRPVCLEELGWCFCIFELHSGSLLHWRFFNILQPSFCRFICANLADILCARKQTVTKQPTSVSSPPDIFNARARAIPVAFQ